MNELGVGEVFVFQFFIDKAYRGADKRASEGLDDGLQDGVVGHAHPDGLVGVEVVARYVAVGVHNKGVGAGEAVFEEGEGVPVHGANILRSHAERGAEHGVFGLLECEAFDLGNGLDRAFELHTTGESIECVGRYNNDAALLKEVDNMPYFALVGIFCIYSSYHLLKLQKYEVFLNCYTFFIEMSFHRRYEEIVFAL